MNKDILTKATAKFIKSLHRKKVRDKERLFIVEGHKSISDFLQEDWDIYALYETEGKQCFADSVIISSAGLRDISSLQNPQGNIAVFHKKDIKISKQVKGWTIVLDSVQDPGNLGTIIRLADWFGLESIVCSKGTVDCFNPKVVQASMGSLSRVNVHYIDLVSYLTELESPIYGTFMNGKNIYKHSIKEPGVLIFGNEGNGISKQIEDLCTTRLSIPQFGNSSNTESLNVAMACSIMLGEIYSQKLKDGQ